MGTNTMKRICVFCGSNRGARIAYTDVAQQLGKAIVSKGLGLVYGGGDVGLMGIIADAVLQKKGEVIGVIPHSLAKKEVAHSGLTELRLVASMHERKAMMEELSDGFIAMPGGFGTLEELFEVVTWAQLGLHSKPIGLLNVEGFFDLLLEFLNHVHKERFVQAKYRHLILKSHSPEKLLDMLIQHHTSETLPKFIDWKDI
ncbi:MAG: TIGR00730 family Rossman fold protein [Candidatus Scalindua sp.]|nr:TIGR00730 family Rossman fold protein [Candidatus Scalindua sp.]